MFSFLKFLNFKSDDDKNKVPNCLAGKTLNLNSPEAKALNIFHNQSQPANIPRKSNGSQISLRSNCRETVTSPGFTFRIAQKAREMRSTTPNIDIPTLSTSYTLENSLNSNNKINGNNTSKDMYDKKRKLMETLDNFGVRKRTRQESDVDAFVNRRQRTISESNAPDRVIVMNGHSHRFNQPIPTVTNSTSVNVENKKTKRQGDFATNMSQPQKKQRTRNNEILSSYSSSKYLLTPGQKRPYPSDHEGGSPDRKHCKSCTCCGSTVVLHNDSNNSNKSDKTTETELSNDLVTVAPSRIFNRSGKTQVFKKICMKTILDDDDDDIAPFTSIEKLVEKKKKAQTKVITIEEHIDKSNEKNGNQFVDSAACVSLPVISKFNEIQPAVTNVLPIVSTTSPSATLNTTPLVQSTMPLTFGLQPSESTPKISEGNKNISPLQFKFGSPISSAVTSNEENNKLTNKVDEKVIDNQTPESTNDKLAINTQNSTVKNPNEQNKFQSPEIKKNINDSFQIGGQNSFNNDKDKPSYQFTVPASKPSESVMNSSTVSNSSKINDSNLHIVQFDTGRSTDSSTKEAPPSLVFGSQIDNSSKQEQASYTFGVSKTDEKQSTPVMQFGVPKANEKQSTPIMQFGVPKANEKQSTPIIQFGAPKVNDNQSTPIMQFGATKVNDKQATPIVQFGVSKVDDKHSTPVLQFGATKTDGLQSTPKLQFGATKGLENPTSTPSLFAFGNNQKSIVNSKSTDSVKFQFGPSKPDSTPSTESTNVVFGSNSQNLFNFGKTDNITLPIGNPPKYDTNTDKSTLKLQFVDGLPIPVFGASTADQSKLQFNTSVSQSTINQGPKLVFGSQTAENKPTVSGMNFANNTANPMFQFNNSGSKLGDKPSETPSGSFPFTSNKTPAFGASASQDFKDKPAYQFNSQKTEETKTQFSTPGFGSQNTSAPFKFGGNEKPASFGTTFPSSNQPLQFTNNTEKTAEPFKFGSSVQTTNNAFQFGANKTDNGPVKFGQASNTFATPGFSGFGNSAPQQTTTFGTVQSSQPSPFGNITSPSAAPTFGSVVSPPSNTFGTNQSFQFGSTNNAPSSSSTFGFGSNSQPAKPDGAYSFNAASSTAPPFQFGQAPPAMSTPQFGGTQPNQGSFGFGSPPMTATVMPGSSQPLFSMGTAPAGERRKAKAVRRRQ